jgi:hypothetical protein
MSISFIGSASAEATSITLPAHQAGDLIILAVGKAASASWSVPAGWTQVMNRTNATAPARGLRVSYKIAASASETSGTWSDAELIAAAVYRDTSNYMTAVHASSGSFNNSTNLRMNTVGVYLQNVVAEFAARLVQESAWIFGAYYAVENGPTVSSLPALYTQRERITGASTGQLILLDTNASMTSVSLTDGVMSSAANSISSTMQIVDTGIAKSGGSSRPVNPFTQQVIG